MTKLWEKGIKFDKEVESFTVGNDYKLDIDLVPYDCKASKAHVKMLGKLGYLNNNEVNKLIKTLNQIIDVHKKGDFKINLSQEDCHTAIEDYLINELGELGKKVHMARSRNDQVLTALRLYYKNKLFDIKTLMKIWIKAISQLAKVNKNIQFPGYTHMQKAMPSSISLWASAYKEAMKNDMKILDSVFELVNQSPLGSAAGYGLPIKIDRQMTSKEMGFSSVQENPIHCQLSRGKDETILISGLSQILLTINRLSSDIIQFSMEELGYISLPEELCTGSSIMPQKKNPDVLELLRGKYHILIGYETQIKTLVANLISGYNRDIQLSKEPIMQAFKLTEECLIISAYIIKRICINKDKCKTAMTDELFSTEKAYKLVKEGFSFREAYKKVAKSIKDSK